MTLKYRIPYQCDICRHINFDLFEWKQPKSRFEFTKRYPVCKCYEWKLEDGYKNIGEPEFFSGMQDKSKTAIYVNDILKLVNDVGSEIFVKCSFGKASRMLLKGEFSKQVTGNLCDIHGFNFTLPLSGIQTFPIVNNYLGKHDLEIMEIIGNVHTRTDIKF